MNRGRWAKRGWSATDFLKVGVIGLGVWFSYSLAFALESSDGISSRITRSDVNSGGGLFTKDLSNNTLTGSLDSIEPVLSIAGDLSGKILGGPQAIFYYPETPSGMILSTNAFNKFSVSWLEPGMQNDDSHQLPVGSYQVRFMPVANGTVLMSSSDFVSANSIPDSIPNPGTVGGRLSPFPISGLLYNQYYSIGVRAFDLAVGNTNPNNESYFIASKTECTLTQTPTLVSVLAVTTNSKALDVTFDAKNPNGYLLPFDFQIDESSLFNGTNQVAGSFNFSSSTVGNITVRFQQSNTSPDLLKNKTYFVRVRSKNKAGVWSGWSNVLSGTTGQPIPTITAISASTDKVNVNWTNSETNSFSRITYNITGLDVTGWDPYPIATEPPFSGVNVATSIPGLDGNTTYYARVSVYDSSDILIGTSAISSVVTGVKNPLSSGADVFSTSATLRWVYPVNMGESGSFSYLFQVSSDSFITTVSSRVFYGGTPSGAATFLGLTGNALYQSSVTAMNRTGTNLYSDPPTLYGAAFTKPNIPAGVTFVAPPSDPTRQVKVAWNRNGNGSSTEYRVDLFSDAGLTDFVASSSTRGTSVFFETPTTNILANRDYYALVTALHDPANVSATGVDVPGIFASTVTAPLAPQLANVVPGQSQLDVTWSSHTAQASNDPDTVYLLDWVKEGDVTHISSTTRSLNLNALPLLANTTYFLTLETLALPAGGWMDASVPMTGVTLAATPTSLTPGPGTTSISFGWNQGVNPFPPNTRYEASISTSIGFSAAISTTVVVTSTGTTFTAVVPNRQYYLGVRAINHQGIPSSLATTFTFSRPEAPVIRSFSVPPFVGKPSPTQLDLVWNPGLNDPDTTFNPAIDGESFSEHAIIGNSFYFGALLPDTTHAFRVRAQAKDLANHAVSLSTTVATRAEVALPVEVVATVDQTTLQFRLERGGNQKTTEYAIQMVQDPVPAIPSLWHLKWLMLDPGNPSHQIAASPTPVWKEFKDWGTPNDATISRVNFLAGSLPLGGHYLQVKTRNSEGEEEVFSATTVIKGVAGVPVVSLIGTPYTPAMSLAQRLYFNAPSLPFKAVGSAHFNFHVNSDPNGAQIGTFDVLRSTGWNGLFNPVDPCSTDSAIGIFHDGGLSGFCIPDEGEYYLHLQGNQLLKNAVGATVGFDGTVYPGSPSFRFFIDRTPPLAGPIVAQWAGFVIPDNGGTLGFQTIDFSWPVIDLGNSVSRSPIVGWAYSFALNDNSPVPVQSTATYFVAGPAVRLSLSSLGVVPATGTYYFKAMGLDLAGNWQPTSTSFIYNFKADSLPPTFKGVSLAGAKMPKSDYHYAAVDPSAPIRLIFSEPMNLASPGALSFIQTHNALGQQVNTSVSFASLATVVETSTTYMDVTPTVPLERGARYEIRSSTWNLRDLGGNPLPANQQFSIAFFTQIDPNARTVFVTLDNGARLEVSANAFGPDPSGVAFDDDVKNDPAPIGATVRGASGAVPRRSGGDFNQVLATKEFNHYASDGTRLTAPFGAPVTLTFGYSDADGNGIVDGTESGHPVKVDRLAIYALDELSGAWMKLPGSRVDTTLHNVSVELRHFSVYALIGTASFDLTEAHPFPVPYRAAKDTGGIVFSFPNSQIAKVQVFTLDGRLVKTLSDDTGAGFVRWDPVDSDGGDPVASDVYLYVIENDQERKVGKLMVIR
ncbi:MAG: Ig-like domain-containing protein [Elusimicrobia bacterium]|nr:Ig-like domain-containing protein [Elusimicrobiota bacterium]